MKSDIEIVSLKAEHIPALSKIDANQLLGYVEAPNADKDLNQDSSPTIKADRELKRWLQLCQSDPQTCFHYVALSRQPLSGELSGQPIGHLAARLAGGEMSIETLAIGEENQGRGVATKLLLEVAMLAVQLEAESLGLEVRASNQRALKLYSRFGLAPVGVRKDYYQTPNELGKYEDAICMWCHEIQTPDFSKRLQSIK